jgi:hypothetical protein
MLKSEILDISKFVPLDTSHFIDFDDEMMDKHPAVGIFHALKALKNKEAESELSQHFLQEAACRLTNRKQLFHFLQNLHQYEEQKVAIQPEVVIEEIVVEEINEEIISKPEIDTPIVEEVTRVVETKQEQPVIEELVVAKDEEVVKPEVEERKDNATFTDTLKNEKHTFIEWIKIFQGGSVPNIPIEEKPIEKEEEETPQSRTTYPNDSRSERVVENIDDLKYADELARKSITFNWDNATETLAKIYAKQGKKQKAIEVYKYLILKYPSKSSYFASQIENLEK